MGDVMICLNLEDGLTKYFELLESGRLVGSNVWDPSDKETLSITIKAAYFPNSAKVRYISCATILESIDGTKYFFPGLDADKLSAKCNMCFNDAMDLEFGFGYSYHEFLDSCSVFYDHQVQDRHIGTAKERCEDIVQFLYALKRLEIPYVINCRHSDMVLDWIIRTYNS